MAEQLYKLSPDRDLQCYFLMPSAIAAMSNATAVPAITGTFNHLGRAAVADSTGANSGSGWGGGSGGGGGGGASHLNSAP